MRGDERESAVPRTAAGRRRDRRHRRLPRRARGRRDAPWQRSAPPAAGWPRWFVLGSNDYFAPKPLNYLAYFRPHRKRRFARPRALGRPARAARRRRVDRPHELAPRRRARRARGRAARTRRRAHRAGTTSGSHRARTDRFGLAVMHSPDSRAGGRRARATTSWSPGTPTAARSACRSSGALVTNCSMPRRLVAGLMRMGPAIVHTSRRDSARASTRRSDSGAGPRRRSFGCASRSGSVH